MASPSPSSSLVLHPDLRPALFSLAILSAYSVAPSIEYGRASPPAFFTVSLALSVAALRPTLLVSLAASASAVFASLFLALDHIHGDCYYSVLQYQTHPRPGLQSDLVYYKRCTQSANAFYMMVVLSFIWSLAFLLGLYRIYTASTYRIEIKDSQTINVNSNSDLCKTSYLNENIGHPV